MGYGGTSDVVVDLRVDDHPDPVAELDRLLDLHTLYFDKADPADLLELDRRRWPTRSGRRLAGLGHAGGADDARTSTTALADWAGIENLEERMVPGRIDPLVLAHLRALESARDRSRN